MEEMILTVLAISGSVFCHPPGALPMPEKQWGEDFHQQGLRPNSPNQDLTTTPSSYLRQWGDDFPQHNFRSNPRNQDLIPPPPPYLQYVSQEAADEFFRIVANTRQTYAQQKQEIQEWAIDHKILAHVQAFDKEVEHSRSLMKFKVSNLLFYLTHALHKYWGVMENQYQTPLQRRKALERLSAENPQVYEVIQYIIDKQMREQDGQRRIPKPPQLFDNSDIGMNQTQIPTEVTRSRLSD